MRKPDEDVVKRVLKEGRGVKLQRGRLKLTWETVIKRDLRKRGLREDMVWIKRIGSCLFVSRS